MRLAAAALAVATLLAACVAVDSHDVLKLEAWETLEVKCDGVEEIAVEDLDTPERPDCVPRGAELVFPDGGRITVDPSGVTGSITREELTWAYVEVGVYGLVAVRAEGSCEVVRSWG